ncbi:MAG: PH domain-containing protein [Candidatus Shapirobacteria bacterium]|jgi:hypothetical protein
MSRSSNLDSIAPDDLSAEVPTKADPVGTPAKKTKKKINTPAPTDFRSEIDNILSTAKKSFTSFKIKPQSFTFSEQELNEEIILVMRQHWFTNVSWILTAIIMSIAPIFLTFVPILASFPPNYQFVAILFYYLIVFAYSFEKFLAWYFNTYIVTDERVVDIDFVNLLNKKFTDAKISMIQDVTSKVSGFSQTLFNYGTILIQTASEVNELVFEKIPNPEHVIKVLQQLRQEEEQEAIDGRIR